MVMVTMLTNRDLQGPIEVPRDKLEKERQKAKKKGSLCTDPKKLDNKLLKGLVLYCTGLSPFNFVLIRLLL